MADYSPDNMYQHAQLLFDNWEHQPGLPALYEWLSAHHIDANVAPHGYITNLVREHAAGGDETARAALGQTTEP